MGVSLVERLDALAEALRAGRDVLPEQLVARGRAVEERAGHRLRLSGEHTVVALAGSTGSGKSSLLNALAGEQLAEVDVLRPTTSEALAVVRGEEGSGDLLDWLAVRRRHTLPGAALASADDRDGLILLDLPDHDSVVVEHRLEAERLVALVDLMVWVVDPQKYADAVLHERYLRRLGTHRDVLLVVLNQVDRLASAEVEACHRDLERLLAADGLAGVPVLDVSARTGQGVEALRRALDDAARRRRAARLRTEADVDAVARDVLVTCGAAPREDRSARDELARTLEVAAGVPLVVDAVRRAWVVRARKATGWPVTRWVARLRPDPLRRLHLEDDADPEVVRTSLPPPGAAERARARSAVRTYVDRTTSGLAEDWVLAARGAVELTDLAGPLDQAVGGTRISPHRRPVWWTVIGALQWLLLVVMLGGLAWLGVLAGLDALRLPTAEPPTLGEVPWPTVAAIAGAVLGVLVALLARGVAGLGARRQARTATARLRASVREVADRLVVAPVAGVVDRQRRVRAAAARATGGR